MGRELQEGDFCPLDDCDGTMVYRDVEGCYCHISPPCGNCVDNPLTCEVCGFEAD